MGSTTIAPFPVPYDTSQAAAEGMKLLNVPKDGLTTIAPMPPTMDRSGSSRASTMADRLRGIPVKRLGDDWLPEPISTVPVGYPEAARAAGIQGTVWVQVLVLRDGTVGSAKVELSIPPELDSAAVACVKQWRFRPSIRNGVPRALNVTVPVRFTLH